MNQHAPLWMQRRRAGLLLAAAAWRVFANPATAVSNAHTVRPILARSGAAMVAAELTEGEVLEALQQLVERATALTKDGKNTEALRLLELVREREQHSPVYISKVGRHCCAFTRRSLLAFLFPRCEFQSRRSAPRGARRTSRLASSTKRSRKHTRASSPTGRMGLGTTASQRLSSR